MEIVFLFEMNFKLGLSTEDYGRITEDLLLFATLRAATLEPWRLASLEEAATSLADPDSTQPHTSSEPDPGAAGDSGGHRHSAGIQDPATIPSGSQTAAPINPKLSATAAAAAGLSLPAGQKRDRAPSPPPGPASPERPWTIRRADDSVTPHSAGQGEA